MAFDDTLSKVKILGESAKYDVCSCFDRRRRVSSNRRTHWIYPAVLPDGRQIRLLKVLFTNECENNCLYCVNRRGRDFRRLSFEETNLATLFIELYRKNLVNGLFLSSAISKDSDSSMERLIKTVEILREKFRFTGYIHLKILPGSSFSYVERAVHLADRVSLNLEAPSEERLKKISEKDFHRDLLLRMKWVKEIGEGRGVAISQTTQFVVGASNECDREIIERVGWLYKKIKLSRVYFSAFQPVLDTPLEAHPSTSPLREHRLYQVDFLLRMYEFSVDEIVFDSNGNLPLERDPKIVWALRNKERFPIEINRASKKELLRVPGIGPKSAARILRMRGRIRTLDELKRVGVVIKRAAPFILIDGKRGEIAY